jgi:predicted DNA-binding ribbon-helix-helix protein
MVRKLVQLKEEQFGALKELARARKVSISELVREGVDLVIAGSTTGTRSELRARAAQVSGKFSSTVKDLSAHHDRYLTEGYGR